MDNDLNVVNNVNAISNNLGLYTVGALYKCK